MTEATETAVDQAAWRAHLRRELLATEGLSSETRVRRAYAAFLDRLGPGPKNFSPHLPALLDDFLACLVGVLPPAEAAQGLAALCIAPDGSETDEAVLIFDLMWPTETTKRGHGVSGDSPASAPRERRNWQRGRLAVEHMLAEVMKREARSEAQQLRPIDFSKPSPPLPYLVEGVLIAGQPCIVGGPVKSLKSCLSLDLAVSLASGTPFLGTYAVPAPRKVAIFSGESGEATIRRTVENICRAKGVGRPETLPLMSVHSSLPSLAALGEWLATNTADVVVLDPVYQLLDGEQASNLYVMGKQFVQVAGLCKDVGATPVLIHHVREGVRPGERPDINMLSYSGVKQFARQWLMLNRKTVYSPARPNYHKLLFMAGGSAGHGTYRVLTVDEGAGKDRWDVIVEEEKAAQADDTQDAEKEEADAHAVTAESQVKDRMGKLVEAMNKLNIPVGDMFLLSKVRETAGVSPRDAEPALQRLVDEGTLEELERSARRRPYRRLK